MASSMVIKVKYGNMLRRFNVNVIENDRLDLDMIGLKSKVSTLFSLNPDADMTLTYIDEDGDVVALVDDDDLRDVMKQQLKFLRIDVQLNNAQGGRPYSRSSESSTPLRSPREQVSGPTKNLPAVADVLQALQKGLEEPVLKYSVDMVSKAASSSPILADLIEVLTKLGISAAIPDFQSESGGETSAREQTSEKPNMSAVPGSGGDEKKKAPKQTDPMYASSSSNQAVIRSDVTGAGIASVGTGTTVTPQRPSVDLNKPPIDCDSIEPVHVKFAPVAVDASNDRKQKKTMNEDITMQDILMQELQSRYFLFPQPRAASSGASRVSSIPAKPVKLDQASDGHSNNSFNECPFLGLPVVSNTSAASVPSRPLYPYKRHYAEAMGGIFHRGIRCDGCGVHPITGPRFKSKVKEDYDLCSICYAEMGTEADYIRMDRPVSFRHPRLFKGLHDHRPGAPPHMMMGCGSKCTRPKLDSRFILDVNINDGTLMPPSTSFTKIWRMRNNGGLVWPLGTQLLWIGGDKFSESLSVEMEIPANGVPVDGELDVAVDFVAPEHPGRYVSYWRMSSPSGQKFGQRVWVLIQVDVTQKNSSLSALPVNLDQPQTTKDPRVVDVNDLSAAKSDLPMPRNYWLTEPEKPNYEQQPKNDQEHKFPINDNLLVGHGVSAPPTTKASTSVSYPIIDLTEEASVNLFSESAPPMPAPVTTASAVSKVSSSAPPVFGNATVTASEATSGMNIEEDRLLKELEEMGFKQIALNKEVLRMNEYNLEQSVDHLVGVAELEWDPMLEELEEMGFKDTEMNKKLLAKNNRSMKRVVMDLINEEKNA